MYPNNNCNTCNDCPPICIIFTVESETLPNYSCATEQAGIYNDKPYYQLYTPGCTILADIFVWWNIITKRWEVTASIGSNEVFCYNVNPGLHPISTNSYKWIENTAEYIITSSLEGPCPGPLPLPDLSELCGEDYNAACVVYTGEDINCLGIESGMTFLEVLTIFNNILPGCDCCEKVPQDCVVGPWSDWEECKCYYEDELPVCGRQYRTRVIITPPANGGIPCPSLIQYRPCTVSSMCFTFGSDICGATLTQITVAPTGIYNDKPYYAFTICGNTQAVWWNNTNDKWHISPLLGVPDVPSFTLDNNNNYYPVSNITTQLWNNPSDDSNYLDLLQSTLDTCPTYLVCFHLHLTIESVVYNFFNSVAPLYTPFDTGNHPFYSYLVSDGTTDYTVNIAYSPSGGVWTARVDGVIIGTLPSSTFYPYGTWVVNPLNPTSYIVSATLGGSCVQPPDVDCVWTCSGFGPCNAGCTQTQTCTITTPASGNGICLPSPPLQQPCCEPSCNQPISPIVEVIGANVVIFFTAVAGATGYTLSYTSDGLSYTNLTSSSPSFSFPWVCGLTYSGWVLTNCATLNSAQTTFNIEIPPCPVGPLCGLLYEPFLSANVSGNSQIHKIDADGVTNPLSLNTTWVATGGLVWTEKLTSTGFFIGGRFNNMSGNIRWSLAKLLCNGQIDNSFIVAPGFVEYNGLQINRGTVRTIDIDNSTQRIYIGGNFSSWNGTPCNNIVCLDYFGNIIPVTAFNTGTGITSTVPQGEATVYCIKVQPDGKILVGGGFYRYNNVSVKAFIRLNTDGTMDNSFLLGASFVDSPNNFPYVNNIQLDSNNNIYVAGSFVSYQGVSSTSFVKIRSNGVIENNFPILNKFTYPLLEHTNWVSLIVGNFIYIGGYFSGYNSIPAAYLVKLNINDASMVPGFAVNTTLTPASGGATITDIKLAANGNILICGNLLGYRNSTNKYYYILNPTTGDVINTVYPNFNIGASQVQHIGVL